MSCIILLTSVLSCDPDADLTKPTSGSRSPGNSKVKVKISLMKNLRPRGQKLSTVDTLLQREMDFIKIKLKENAAVIFLYFTVACDSKQGNTFGTFVQLYINLVFESIYDLFFRNNINRYTQE